MTVRIVTDSSCDLPTGVIARYGIYVVPLYINVGSQSYLDGIDLTRDEFGKVNLFRTTDHRSTLSPKISRDV